LTASPPRRSTLFVAFDAEELGFLGSRHFVEHCPVPRASLVAMVNLDMVGRVGERGANLRIEGVGSVGGFADVVARVAAALPECRLRETAAPRSDHWPFLLRQIPALFVHSGVHDDYHRPSDVLERVRVDGVSKVADLVRELVQTFGDASERPEFAPEVVRRSFVRRRR
jgi:aminopeptidase YwaD